MTLPRYDAGIDPGNSWAETRDLKPQDLLLRRHGFAIAARPRIGPALWSRGGVRLTEAEALDRCYAEMMTTEE